MAESFEIKPEHLIELRHLAGIVMTESGADEIIGIDMGDAAELKNLLLEASQLDSMKEPVVDQGSVSELALLMAEVSAAPQAIVPRSGFSGR